MDAQLLTKIIHMSALTIVLIVFVLRGLTLFVGVTEGKYNPIGRKAFTGLQHFAFTLIVITGVILLWMKDFQVQPWFYAKIILFFVILSALSKAFKSDDHLLMAQRRAGFVIASVALFATMVLVITKPVFA